MTQTTPSRDTSTKSQPSTYKEPFTPWYREPWAWYVMGILMITFAWGGFQIYTALTHQDSVVIDDYYKNGKTINQDMTRIRNARTMTIEGILTIDELTGEAIVKMQGSPNSWPQQLKLNFLSPVFKDRDKTIMLTRSFGTDHNSVVGTTQSEQNPIYVGQLEMPIAGRYYLQLETLNELIPKTSYENGWKITLEAIVSPKTRITLKNPDA